MKIKLITMLILIFSFHGHADSFICDAQQLTKNLKQSLVNNLSDKITKDGVVAAVPFCHENVSQIAKKAAGQNIQKFAFGRTSHKVRNSKNAPEEWMRPYFKEFVGKKMSDFDKKMIVHKFENSKRAYLEPLYVQTMCLQCHGNNINKDLSQKIYSIYPSDQARDFKLGEFRGFVWVKEK